MIIPEEYHEYYKNILCTNIKDRTPAPSRDEEEENDTDLE